MPPQVQNLGQSQLRISSWCHISHPTWKLLFVPKISIKHNLTKPCFQLWPSQSGSESDKFLKRVNFHELHILNFSQLVHQCWINYLNQQESKPSKGLVPFTQLLKVRRGKLVLALPSIQFS